jgi:cyclic pyranopterin monophosphate synthase
MKQEPTTAHMVDVSAKPIVARSAIASGRLVLKPATIQAILKKQIEKGDALEIARVAAVLAAKNTPQILPLCHPLPVESIDVSLQLAKTSVTCTTTVRTHWKTGVEMEALVATSTALLTVWDLVKGREKTPDGQYVNTVIQDLRVVRKEKGR